MERLVYEMSLREQGYELIAGMDEVGRGPLAGPVVTACVILPLERPIEGVDDSKKLSRRKRAELFKKIRQEAVSIGIGVVEPAVIDEINILKATRLAMEMAVGDMNVNPQYILIDAVENLKLPMPHRGIIRGDSLSYLVGAASIVAKETRDAMMENYNKRYPGYGFSQNMGYGTAEHRTALQSLGPCEIHRRSFISKYL